MNRFHGPVDPSPTTIPVVTDHRLRDEVGTHVAALMLGAVIQGGPRRRANGRIPSPRPTNAERRSVTPISFVVQNLRGSLPPDNFLIRADPPDGVAPDTMDRQLSRWENEGGRVVPAVHRRGSDPRVAR